MSNEDIYDIQYTHSFIKLSFIDVDTNKTLYSNMIKDIGSIDLLINLMNLFILFSTALKIPFMTVLIVPPTKSIMVIPIVLKILTTLSFSHTNLSHNGFITLS